MLIELIIALLLGCTIGTFTGLIPGIHINLVTVVLLANLYLFEKFEPIVPVVFIVSMAITHTFIDFIPSIFLGAPEEDTFLSILPGHEMLKEGKAHEAIILTLYGSIFGLAIILIFTPIFIFIIPLVYSILQLTLPFILIFTSCYLLLREKQTSTAIIVFLLSGILGYLTLNLPIKQPLLPLLTGLFGTSALLISTKTNPIIPPQILEKLKNIKLSPKEILTSNIGAIISAPLCSFLPGIGAGHAAVIGSEIIKQSRTSFITLLGAINTIVMGLSFVTLYLIGRTRTGAAVAIDKIIPELTLPTLFIILLVVIFSGIFSFFIAIKISKIFSKHINKISYKKLSLFIIFLLLVINFVFSNFLGLIVLITATALGVFTIQSNIKRINLMGALLIPTIVFYLFL